MVDLEKNNTIWINWINSPVVTSELRGSTINCYAIGEIDKRIDAD